MTTPLATLAYLHQILSGSSNYAVVSQDSLGNLSISAEFNPGDDTTELTPLVGPTGAAGAAQFELRPEPEVLADPSELPTDLTNTDADIGKTYFIATYNGDECISSGAFIWFGTEFRYLPFGTQGPPGPYPVLVPFVSLPGPNQVSQVDVNDDDEVDPGDGSAANPFLMTFELSVPSGPQGPSATLASFDDVQETIPPTVGQFLGFGGEYAEELPLWQPLSVGDIIPQPYIIPEGAFSSYAGITFDETVTVCTYAVPPKSFPWKPLVWGQIEMFGLEISLQTMFVGVEVMLGHPTVEGGGTLVARGFGNSLGGVVTIVPHTSSPGSQQSESTAMTPWNAVGFVPAQHTGAEGTLYVNLVNDGGVAIYDFDASNSQLFVLACPSSPPYAPVVLGALRTKVALSAKTVTAGS